MQLRPKTRPVTITGIGTRLLLAASLAATPLLVAEIVPAEVDFTPKMLETADAARVGHLGDPALGLALDDWWLQWHPSGRIFTSSDSNRSDASLVHAWQPPQGAAPARRVGALNVSAPWVLSHSGETLFARLDLHGSPLPPKAGMVLGCLRLGEKKKLWHVALQRGDAVGSARFTKDDRALLLSTEFMNQKVLMLLDAATGAVLGRTPPAGTDRRPGGLRPDAGSMEGRIHLAATAGPRRHAATTGAHGPAAGGRGPAYQAEAGSPARPGNLGF